MRLTNLVSINLYKWNSATLELFHSAGTADTSHHVFWCGDLNYRVGLERARVEELISQRDWTVSIISIIIILSALSSHSCFMINLHKKYYLVLVQSLHSVCDGIFFARECFWTIFRTTNCFPSFVQIWCKHKCLWFIRKKSYSILDSKFKKYIDTLLML